MKTENVVLNVELTGLKHFKSGKVREVFDLGDKLLIVATDRISAFDYVLPSGIPFKGTVLTGLSKFWFEYTKDIVRNHFITDVVEPYAQGVEGRAMVVVKTNVFPIECVVRGYLAGSGWKEYSKSWSVCGIKLKGGYKEAQKLDEPIFTPSTKAESGHDENISEKRCADIIGAEWTKKLRETSLKLYKKAHDYAWEKGIIIADTKFEFGALNGELILVDEVLTPDSSRFWPKGTYAPGASPFSFDKQFVRDYLESIKWNKKPPVPELPTDIIRKTSEKYLEAYRCIAGCDVCA